MFPVVVTEYVDDVMGDTLDAVDEDVGRSCIRSGSAEVWPDLHDKRSVMSFLVRPVAVLTGQVFFAPLCHLAAELFKCRLVRRRHRIKLSRSNQGHMTLKDCIS